MEERAEKQAPVVSLATFAVESIGKFRLMVPSAGDNVRHQVARLDNAITAAIKESGMSSGEVLGIIERQTTLGPFGRKYMREYYEENGASKEELSDLMIKTLIMLEMRLKDPDINTILDSVDPNVDYRLPQVSEKL